MDAATGLLYKGNGQYYDPETGRFLSRDANPNNTNPYVPWDPTGAIIGPLGIAALFFTRRKKGSKWATLLILLLAVGSLSMTLAACGGSGNGQQQSQPSQIPNGNQASVDAGPGTDTGNGVSSSGSATQTPTYTPCPPTPTSTSIPMPTPTTVSTSTPIPISCGDLSDFRARRACRTYLALRDHPGWWNGNQTGTLTPQAFAGLLFRMEFSDYFKDIGESIQQETVVRNFYAHWMHGWEGAKGDTRLANDMGVFHLS